METENHERFRKSKVKNKSIVSKIISYLVIFHDYISKSWKSSIFTFHFSLFTFHFSIFTFHLSIFTFHFIMWIRITLCGCSIFQLVVLFGRGIAFYTLFIWMYYSGGVLIFTYYSDGCIIREGYYFLHIFSNVCIIRENIQVSWNLLEIKKNVYCYNLWNPGAKYFSTKKIRNRRSTRVYHLCSEKS